MSDAPESAGSVLVAVLTFRRPGALAELVPLLLEQAREQVRAGRTAAVLVVDNDPAGSGGAAVEAHLGHDLTYLVEARPGISAARNRALAEANGYELLVFIDDDELPAPDWLRRLIETRERYDAAAVAGRVQSEVTGELDPWIAAGGYFERRHRVDVVTGTEIPVAATNNLLLDLRVVRALGLTFDEAFGLSGGEDSLLTRTLTSRGHRMVWCADAVVIDRVPAERVTRRWVLLRAVSSGNSEARVALRLAGGGGRSMVARVRLFAGGVIRVLAGAAAAAVGVLTGRLDRRARGWRTAARGVGLAAGALDWTYLEYRR